MKRVLFNENGDGVKQVNHYYPFGMKFFNEESGTDNRFLYSGKELIEEVGEYFFGARMYNASIARWQVIDPMAETTYSWSPYNYTLNNPINFIDPTGMASQDPQEPLPFFTIKNGQITYNHDSRASFSRPLDWADWGGVTLKAYEQMGQTRMYYKQFKCSTFILWEQRIEYVDKITREHVADTYQYYWENSGNNSIRLWTINTTSYGKGWSPPMKLIDPYATNRGGGWDTNIDDATTVAGLEMAGVGYGLNDYAESIVKYKYGTRTMTAAQKTVAAKVSALKAAKYAKTIGRGVGVIGVTITAFEGFSDGNMSAGDWTKVSLGLITTFTPFGWAYGLVDIGTLVITGESLTDKVGTAIDNW